MTRALVLMMLAAWVAVLAGGCGVGDAAQDDDRASAEQDGGWPGIGDRAAARRHADDTR